ncbi:hypothetical protein PP175_19110 [Aneurinibacillus sp. Ricciae_BoGa-3]|uniref:hypothetical protein n=1 Tax=Aneurinibacillus sp. Ricciae_BoGa-3 TaxID=3022697 RepID=UPI00234100A4|nr:hypothetical protein [Aneurinibacillus sp. Ricciae_BoGa-3]WCK53439.1 hypothetical protein PP175_19110 [Aneurinibacillus sp. Ricciae_BoGa-3]
MHSKLLVDATDLAQWADRRDSQSKLPELVRRLILASSVHIDRISFAAGEGVSLGGWDGIAIAEEGDGFVPTGTSVWEMGVNKSVKGKADDDYRKRCDNPLFMTPSETTYVFITPRRWRDKEIWIIEKQKEGVWKEVRAYDADDLETWLSLTPTIHVWLSILLGKHPQNSIDLGGYWDDWAEETQPVLTPELVLAGREDTTMEIYQWLKSRNGPLTLQAETRDEAIAVLTAAIYQLSPKEKEFFLARSIVVYNLDAWNYLTSSQNDLILIPTFHISDGLSRAIKNGHHIFVPLGRSDSSTVNTLQIPRLSRDKVAQILIKNGIGVDQSQKLALLARRGLSTFRRRMALSPEIKQPIWARPNEARQLLPILLAGGWDEAKEGDKEAIADLANNSYEEISETLVRWSNESDPPVRRIGTSWYIISKEDAWSQLVRYVTPTDIERFTAFALQVLSTPDPRYKLPSEQQWMASTIGHPPIYSGLFIRNIADTLAFMASREDSFHSVFSLRQHAVNIIFKLLENARNNWRIWATLSPVLPLLAEAAPDQFLDAIEEEITNKEVIIKLFADHEDTLFSSSPHTGLLWALETLAWSSDYIGRSAMVLAMLARLDPGGKLSNRPKNSLREIFLTWCPQTSASLDQRLQVLKAVLRREPEVAWDLLCRLLPQVGGIGHITASPKWREWAPDYKRDISVAEYDKATHEIIRILLTQVGKSGVRWAEIIQAMPLLPLEDFKSVINALRDMSELGVDYKDGAQIWNALRKQISRHRSFPDADWALPEKMVDEIEEIFYKFEPQEPVSRYSWLFSNSPQLPNGREADWEEQEKNLHQARSEALVSIYKCFGKEGIINVMNNVEHPFQFGITLGETGMIEDEEDKLLDVYLDAPKQSYVQFARGYIFGRLKNLGTNWGKEKLKSIKIHWTTNKITEILICLPIEENTWDLVEASGEEVERRYWSLIAPYSINEAGLNRAVNKYLNFNLTYSAIELLAIHKEAADLTQIVNALSQSLTKSPKDSIPTNSFFYHLSELFHKLENAKGIEEGLIASLEWAYFSILDRYGHAPQLLHRELARNPIFFAEVISLVYHSENDETKEVPAEDMERATRGYSLLKSWRTIPGIQEDMSVDGETLMEWVKDALKATSELGRGTFGANHIGNVLSTSPVGSDGAWPHEAVRDVLEEFANKHLETGFKIGVYNSRGIFSKSLREGGAQERELAERYNSYAITIGARWIRTSALLRSISDNYSREARQEDIRAELREDLDQY